MELRTSKWNRFCLFILLCGSQISTMCRGRCVSNCSGLEPGDYQSCESCQMFITCSSTGLHHKFCTETVWDDVAKKCLYESITCGEERTDGTGDVVCSKEELKPLCPTPTNLRLKRVYQLEVQKSDQFPDPCDKQLFLSDFFKHYTVCRFVQRSDLIGTIQFIPQQLVNTRAEIIENLQWEIANNCPQPVHSLYHVQYDCNPFAISLHQKTSLTGNYIVVTNSLDIYESYFYSSSKGAFNSWLNSYTPQYDISQYHCKLFIKQDTKVVFGKPQSLLHENATLILLNETSQRTYTSSNHPPQGKITAIGTDRMMTLQFIGTPWASSDVLIIPFKAVDNGNITVTCGLLMNQGTPTTARTSLSEKTQSTTWNDATVNSSVPGVDTTIDTSSPQSGTSEDYEPTGGRSTNPSFDDSTTVNTLSKSGVNPKDSQQASNGVIIGATTGVVIIIVTATAILLLLILKRKKKLKDTDKCVVNPVYNYEPSNCNVTCPKQNNIPMTGSATLLDAIYAKSNKPGVYETIPDKAVVQTSTVDQDDMIENDVYNSDGCFDDGIPGELIDNDVYQESTMAKEHEAVTSDFNGAMTDVYDESNVAEDHDAETDDKSGDMLKGHVYVDLQSTSDPLTGQRAYDELQLEEPKEITPRSVNNGAIHADVSGESSIEMVENSIYNE